MENEIMNNEEMVLDDIDLEEDVIVVCEDPENSDENGGLGFVIALGAIAVVGIAGLVLKSKGKFEEWTIKRLRKKGYAVTKLEEADVEDDERCEEVADEIDE